jgi:hypothetical protein
MVMLTILAADGASRLQKSDRHVFVWVGTQEIRVRVGGVSRQRVYQLTTQGSVWLAEDVDRWIADRRTRAGQPRVERQ